jgi:hypothetical protein
MARTAHPAFDTINESATPASITPDRMLAARNRLNWPAQAMIDWI